MSSSIPNLLDIVEAASQDVTEVTGTGMVPLLDSLTDGIPHFALCADGFDDSPSDARLKTDIEQVGTTVYGLPRYRFRYLTGPERFEGVMAQDVLKVMPEAVSTRADGFYTVNYARLGIRMTQA